MSITSLRRLLPALVGGILLLALSSLAEAFERPRCEACRRSWIDSPSRMRVVLNYSGHRKMFKLCSPVCVCEFMEDYPDKEPELIEVIDFRDQKELHAMLYSVDQMTFLFGVPGDDQDTHAPFVAAFPLEDEAKKAQKTLGGEIMEWKKIMERCAKVAKEEEEKKYEPPPPLRKRNPKK